MQKTTKTLLTKIFALLTVIFCVFALALGAIGCAKEETKAVVKVSVNGNVLTVTYFDGKTETSENLTIEGEKYVECGHDAYVRLSDAMVAEYDEDEEIRSDVCRATIYGCTVCNHVYATYEKHVLGAEDANGKFVEGATTEVAATCTEEGYKGQICKYCDYIEGEILSIVDHDFTEFKLIVDKDLDKCTQVWFEGKQVCNDCGLTQLVVKQPTGHKFENIRVGTYATETTKATLIADCANEDCVGGANKDGNAILVKELYTLGSEEYKKAIGDHTATGHYATYTYEYEGVTYTVAENTLELHTTVVDDYDKWVADGKPTISVVAGAAEINCKDYTNAVYLCDECASAVAIKVKKAHTVSEDAKYIRTTADCDSLDVSNPNAAVGIETYVCEVETCKAEVPVEITKPYGHSFTKLVENSIVENDDGTINVTFECTNEFSGVKCGETHTEKGIKDFEKKDANCEEAGYIKYTKDGETITKEIIANGKHVLKGYDKAVLENSTLKFEEVKAFVDKGLHFESGSPAKCGDSAKAVVICDVCTHAVPVQVRRDHIETNVTDRVEADCTNPGSYKFNCAYEDCEYHADKKLTGVIETVGHQLSYVAGSVNTTNKTIKVTCAVQNCPFHTETVANYDSIVEERSMTCGDYAEGKTNSNTYNKVVLPGETDEYTVVETIANDIHVLNNKSVKEGSEFAIGTPGIHPFSGELADCTETAESVFICEECKFAIKVTVKGECKVPADLEAVTKTDPVSCELDAYKYWICDKIGSNGQPCGLRHDLEKVADKTGHTFTKEVAKSAVVDGKVTLSCACGQDFVVTLANATKVDKSTCQDEIIEYTAEYVSTVNVGYKQSVTFTVVDKNVGTHTWLGEDLDKDGVIEAGDTTSGQVEERLVCTYVEKDGDTVIYRGWGYYCTECNQYFIQAWEIPSARPWN